MYVKPALPARQVKENPVNKAKKEAAPAYAGASMSRFLTSCACVVGSTFRPFRVANSLTSAPNEGSPAFPFTTL